MKWIRGLALLLLGALLLGLFAGCATEEEYEEESSLPELANTGEEAALTLAFSDPGDAYVKALSEIIEKYRADYPGTQIELKPYCTEEELTELLRTGGADIVEVEGERQGALVEEGLLWNFHPYFKAWREEPVIYSFARQAVESMGEKQAYILPADFRQEVLFYRADWIDEYNSQVESEEDEANVKTWGQLCATAKKLGDKGRLALAGKGRLGKYFDCILWSRASRDAMKGPCAAYFTEEDEEVATLFATPAGVDAAHRFSLVMEEAALPGCEDWTIDEALEAFKTGKACMLLADSSYQKELEAALPEGALGVEGFTRTDNNLCVTRLDFWGWAISQKSQYKETAAHFLTYLSNADNNTHIAKTAGTLPLHREALLMEPGFSEGDRAPEMRMAQLSAEYHYVNRPDMYVQASEDFPALYEQRLRAFLSGESTEEALLEELDAFWMEAYESQPDNWSKKKEKKEGS